MAGSEQLSLCCRIAHEKTQKAGVSGVSLIDLYEFDL
jgi:hypothetical protein